MNIGQNYAQKRAFVEVLLAQAMRVMKGFDYIRYARESQTEAEFIRIGDVAGRAVTLDVTAFSLCDILMAICDYIANGPSGDKVIKCIVHDEDRLFKASKLFKGVA